MNATVVTLERRAHYGGRKGRAAVRRLRAQGFTVQRNRWGELTIFRSNRWRWSSFTATVLDNGDAGGVCRDLYASVGGEP